MEAHFNASLTAYKSSYPRSQPISRAGQPDRPVAEVALASVAVRSTRSEVYTFGGSLEPMAGEGGTLLDNYRQIRVTVQEQLASLAGHFEVPSERDTPVTQESKSMLDLAGPSANTMDVLTEYWSRENTARRIYAIAMMGYQEGMDKADFAEKATSMITQAYNDVRAMISFDFPQLVMDTRRTVLDALQQFGNGTLPGEISF